MKTFYKLALLLTLAMPAAHVSAQARGNIAGKIDSVVMLDDGYITIDGDQLVVRASELVITYKGNAVRPSVLAEGQTVRYSIRSDGSVSEIMLIGPSLELDKINNQ